MNRYDLRRGTVYRARAEEVYQGLEAGSFRLALVDGPYNLRIAEWDKFPSWDAFRDFYRGHLEAIGRLLMPSSWLLLWGSDESEGELRPLVRSLGWEYCGRVTWHKTNPPSQKGIEDRRTWPDATEVLGCWRRECVGSLAGPAQMIAYAAGESDRNEIRKWLHYERQRAGLKGDDLEAAVNEAGGKGNMTCRHSFTESQWCMPTWEQWKALHVAWNRRGLPDGRPYLQRDRSRVYDLTDPADHDALRAEYDALRAPFEMPSGGLLNVWRDPLVWSPERLVRADGSALHPCQKRLDHVERLIRAHTRPGEAVLSVFSGTCREAVVCEHLPEPEARRYVCIEADEDGRGYIDAVLPSLRLDPTAGLKPGQVGLFG